MSVREQLSPRPAGAGAVRALSAIAAQEEDWSRYLPSFFDSTPSSPRESTQSTSMAALAAAVSPEPPMPALRSSSEHQRQVSEDSVRSFGLPLSARASVVYPSATPSASGVRGPRPPSLLPQQHKHTRSTSSGSDLRQMMPQSAPPVSAFEVGVGRMPSTRRSVERSFSASGVGAAARERTNSEGGLLTKSVSLTRPVTRKPVPAYRIESLIGQPQSTPLPGTQHPALPAEPEAQEEAEVDDISDPVSRQPSQSRPVSHSPFYSQNDSSSDLPLGPHAAGVDVQRSSRGPPAPSRKSSVSISGLDPALLEFMPQFAGMKEATHVIMPDMPTEYQPQSQGQQGKGKKRESF